MGTSNCKLEKIKEIKIDFKEQINSNKEINKEWDKIKSYSDYNYIHDFYDDILCEPSYELLNVTPFTDEVWKTIVRINMDVKDTERINENKLKYIIDIAPTECLLYLIDNGLWKTEDAMDRLLNDESMFCLPDIAIQDENYFENKFNWVICLHSRGINLNLQCDYFRNTLMHKLFINWETEDDEDHENEDLRPYIVCDRMFHIVLNVIMFLVDNGADPMLENSYGYTVIDMIKKSIHFTKKQKRQLILILKNFI
jgi:hypothetical protein